MMREFEITPTQSGHFDQIVEILCQNPLFERYGLDASKARAQLQTAHADPKSRLYSLLEGKQCLGFAWIEAGAGFAKSDYLRLLAVHPRHQGRGIGKILVHYFEDKIAHPFGLFLLATADNQGARRFYEGLGYVHLGTIPSYVVPGIDEAIYFKKP